MAQASSMTSAFDSADVICDVTSPGTADDVTNQKKFESEMLQQDSYANDEPPSYSIFIISKNDRQQLQLTPAEDSDGSLVTSPRRHSAIQLAYNPHHEDTNRSDRSLSDVSNCRGCQSKNKGQQGDELSMELNSWRHFTSNTTMHGIKYVFEDRPFTLRRMLWLVCVATCVVLFAYQAIDRVCTYFQYSSNVAVQVHYKSEVEFPAVTVCNYNSYRLTSVVDRGLYDVIESVYSADRLSSVPATFKSAAARQTNVSTIFSSSQEDFTAFVLGTAHQMSDFIYSCSWRGAKCSLVDNITTSLTDFGVCYTFNSANRAQPFTVDRSGAGFALSLTLNIEQYEYMSGPHQEAGVKVLLHDPSEIPLVRDFGFAVAPGTHNLAVVNRQVVNGLPLPYGLCEDGARTRSQCLAECQAQQIWQRCKCRDVYMPPVSSNDVVCNMTQSFFCVRENLAVMVREDLTECRCPVRCRHIVYEPELSYAHVSKMTFDRLFESDRTAQVELYTKLNHAREVAHRVNPLLAEVDRSLIGDVIGAYDNYMQSLMHVWQMFDDDDYLMERYGVSHQLIDDYGLAVVDFSALNDSFTSKAKESLKVFPDLRNYNSLEFQIKYALRPDQPGWLQQKLEECVAKAVAANDSCFADNVSTDYGRCNDYKPVGEYGAELCYYPKQYLNDAAVLAMAMLNVIQHLEETYHEHVSKIFDGTSFNYSSSDRHLECLSVLHNVTELWLQLLPEFKGYVDVYTSQCSWQTKLDMFQKVVTWLNRMRDPEPLGEILKPCQWYQLTSWEQITSGSSYDQFLAYKEAAIKVYGEAKTVRVPLSMQADTVIKEVMSRQQFVTEPLEAFLQSGRSFNVTKLGLYKYFQEMSSIMSVDVATLANDRFASELLQFISKVSDIHNNMKAMYVNVFNLSVPVLDDKMINSMWIVQYARQLAATDAQLTRYIDQLATDRENSILGIETVLYSRYLDVMQELLTEVLSSYQQLQTAMTALLLDLEDYAEAGNLNEQFYRQNMIKLDIFYKELSYEQISQQVSFDVLSLCSEIGGLLGLLLGSSVLTVCELVDFVALLCTMKLRSNSRKKRHQK